MRKFFLNGFIAAVTFAIHHRTSVDVLSLSYGDRVKETVMNERLIRMKDVMRITGLSRSRIYQYIAEDKFPDSVSIGGRSVAWVESEVFKWVKSVIGRRDDFLIYSYD